MTYFVHGNPENIGGCDHLLRRSRHRAAVPRGEALAERGRVPLLRSHRTNVPQDRRIWKCKAITCRKQFSIKVGTIFEDSPIPLGKWLAATWLISNCKNGVSSYEISR